MRVNISHWLHSRAGGNTIVLAAVVALIVSACVTNWPAGPYELGGAWGAILGIASTLLTALMMQLTNKSYNMLRSDTALPAAMFTTLMLALPTLATTPGIGMLLAPAMTAGAYLLFSTYADPSTRRRVFLMFTCVSTLAFVSPIFIYYLPVMLLGCAQMRIFDLRTLLAALIGIITPPWILVGSGLVAIGDLPRPTFSTPNIMIEEPYTLTVLGVSALVIIAGICFTSANLIKVYSYNSRTRAFNGYYTVMFLATVLLTIIDFNNLISYLPLLMAMTAYQASHFFIPQNSGRHNWIGIVILLAISWSLFAWYIWISTPHIYVSSPTATYLYSTPL